MQQTAAEQIRINPTIIKSPLKIESVEEPRPTKWTKEQYYKLADLGFFDGKKVELIEGDIIQMAAMNSPHITCVMIIGELLREIFGSNFYIRTPGALDFGKSSQPEPDVAVVRGKARDYVAEHPKKAILIVEVADTTLRKDRSLKAKLYAKNGIEDYWILNLKDRTLEVYRQPKKDKKIGYIYTENRIFTEDDQVTPLAAPKAKIKIADILP